MKKCALIGLGKMGLKLAQNMLKQGIQVVGFDLNEKFRQEFANMGGLSVKNLKELIENLPEQKIIWCMVPAGDATKNLIQELSMSLKKGDIVIDGGNSFYKDSVENYNKLKEKHISFLDCGTSGGQSGALNGANLMIGGDKEAFEEIKWLFESVSKENGYLYTGKPGSGHFLKMVHNGIEYGMMQAIAEGFDFLNQSDYDYDYEKVCTLWNNGSVIRSWLIELAGNAFAKQPKLSDIEGVMYSSGEGKWMVNEAIEREISIPVITASLLTRYKSHDNEMFAGKVVASLRREFGGHNVKSN